MELPSPMERLFMVAMWVFGKTEGGNPCSLQSGIIGYQVAVLALPTTLMVEQHWRSSANVWHSNR
jgi:transcription-repair coupling factor (superfamily II helicase)